MTRPFAAAIFDRFTFLALTATARWVYPIGLCASSSTGCCPAAGFSVCAYVTRVPRIRPTLYSKAFQYMNFSDLGLPPELRVLDSEAMVRVVEVEFVDDHSRAIVPRANIERIEG